MPTLAILAAYLLAVTILALCAYQALSPAFK
jgi:hypothetical protein